MADMAETSEALELKSAEGVGRFGAADHSPLITREVFKLPHPQEGEPSLHVVEVGGTQFALVNLRAVSDAEVSELAGAELDSAASRVRQAHAMAELQALESVLRRSTEVTVNDTLLDAIQ